MKRTLSLFLSFVLVFSMVLGTFTVNVSAAVTGGTFTADGEKVKAFSIDFNNYDNSRWTNVVYKVSNEFDPAQIFNAKTSATTTAGDNKGVVKVEILSKDSDASDKYMKLKDVAGDGSYFNRFYFNTGATTILEDETMHLSLDIKADDSNYRKIFGFARHHNPTITYIKHILEFTSDGNLKFFGNSTDIIYDTDWHKYDFLLTTTGVKCYIDGILQTEYSDKNINSYLKSDSYSYNAFGFMFAPVNDNGTQIYQNDVVDTSLCFDNLSATVFADSDVVTDEISIESIGSDGIVSYDATSIEFTTNYDLTNLKPEYIVFSPEKSVTSLSASSDGLGNYTYTAQLESELQAWTTYTLTIDNDALGGSKYTLDGNGFPVPVIPYISDTFDVTPAPFSLKAPEFSVVGSTLTVDTIFANSTLDPKWAKFVLVTKDANGVLTNIETSSLKDVITDADGEPVTLTSEGFNEGSAELLVIDGYTNKPLFDACYGYNYDETPYEDETPVATSDAAANTIVLKEYANNTKFDHENNKMLVNLNTGIDAAVQGILYVYEGSLSDGTPVYADYVTTAANGTLLKEIKFDSSIASATKDYKIAFYSNDTAAIEDSFKVYSSTDYKNIKRNNIYTNAVNTSTFSGLKQVITGTDDLGNVINDAWTVFASDINTANYDAVKDKEAVFVNLSAILNTLADYNALCRAFETLSLEQKNKENTPSDPKPESNNRKPGSSTVSITATPSKPSTEDSSAGGSVAFSDMSGHWAQKHAEALVKKGIVNGYADGSFRGDNPITRAELTKIIVEALNVPEKEDKNFADVSSSSWYNSYVSRAATAGVVNGFEDGSFKPEANVSRQDAVLMIWRAMNLTSQLPEGFKYFADEYDIQDYSSEAIRCLGDLGIVTGDKEGFKPLNNITRAEMAAVICRAIDYIESHLQ